MRVRAWWASRGARRLFARLGVGACLLAGSAATLFPLLWMLSTSLKSQIQVYAYPPVWIPSPPRWQNYADAMTQIPYLRFFENSVIVSALSLVGALLSSSVVAYAFARLRARGRDLLFLLVLATMMLPAYVQLVPQYMLFRGLGWVNTFLPLIVPNWFAGAFYVFLLRQFYLTLPFDLDESAYLDGCSVLGVYWRIIVPLSRPALATVAIFQFFGAWNDFLYPLIYLNSDKKFTLALGLSFLVGANGLQTSWNVLMAASVVTLLPCLVIFFFAQRQFVQGIVLTGIKG
jgi:multiple sugar transport system permease protein